MLKPVRTGLDRLAAGEGPALRDVPIALLCHPASVTRELVHARDVVASRSVGARVVSLLGPEHGIDAAAQDMEPVDTGAGDAKAAPVGLERAPPVYSLYGDSFESLRPTPEMFHGAAWLLCDLQDVGSRYYTYVWTAAMAAEVALRAGLRVLLLDRPNPLGGTEDAVEGGGIERGQESFVGYHDVAVRHGMTLGELVTMTLRERGVACERLEVLRCAGWRRGLALDDTDVPWVMPSPNMPTLDTATVYPGQCLLEGTNLSEGRGTTRPFELFGAPWLNGQALARALAPEDVPGLALRPARFRPMFQKHGGETCGGLQLHVRAGERARVRSLRTSWAILSACWALGAGAMRWRTEPYEFVADRPAVDLLAGGAWLRAAIESGARADALTRAQEPSRRAFLSRRRPHLLYPG
ncbi:MAG: DUF1343 domain-containing protein [Myxococcales bacterium]|nr:DUF1343 domain-containing protein [Myxococcales bacterium]